MYIGFLVNLYAECIMRNAGLDEAQARIKIARRNANNLRYADDTTLTAESKDQPRSPTLQVNSLPTEVQGKNFMANRWGNSGNSDRLGLQNHSRW